MVIVKKSDVISRGAQVKQDSIIDDEWTITTLRIQKKMIHDIEEVLKDRPGMKKSVWILEAINEKLIDEKNL